jgi:alkylation response protein AidB-like acyl-CoA dehydrogenase
MMLLARTQPFDPSPHPPGKGPTDDLSILVVDIRKSLGSGLTIRPIQTMINMPTAQLYFDNMWVPKENLIGRIGQGREIIRDTFSIQVPIPFLSRL